MEERHWIQAIIPNAALDNVFVYTGYSCCGKKCSVPEGRQFTCIVCDNRNCVSASRVAFKFEAVDVTGFGFSHLAMELEASTLFASAKEQTTSAVKLETSKLLRSA
uniref:Uncharacterized protein n=1 Tax=Chenopodium quinoa TaxID=63459 RepID=A0A803LJH5_CHEQI